MAVILIAGGGAIALNPGGSNTAAQTQAQPVNTSVEIDDQTTGGTTVIVESVNLSEGGFVVIHDTSLQAGDTVGSVVGVSAYLEAGEHHNVPVTLARPLNASEVVIAMPHADTNDNQVYDFVITNGSVDGPFTRNETDGNASAITDAGLITVREGAAPSMSLMFGDQTSEGDNVTVPSVTLYRGGYLVVYNTTEEGDVGNVIGVSRYLEPGTYFNLEIPLAQPLDVQNQTDVTLVVRPHFETNGNLVFDYVISNGTIDGPYTENGSIVNATGTVTLGEPTGTPTETATGTPTETANETETETP